jgi:RNA polymerase sigma factor (sigma-70 family)
MIFKPSPQQLNRTFGTPKAMEITRSVVTGLMTGSQMPSGSPENRAWNRAYDRLYLACADFVVGYVKRKFPYFNDADSQDVLMDTLVRLRHNVSSQVRKGNFDPDQVKLEAWVMKICFQAAVDLRRKSSKRRGEFSIDAANLKNEEGSFHEVFGEEDQVMNWWLESEESEEQSGKAGELMKALEELGGRTQRMLAIFIDILSGAKPVEIAERHGVSRGTVDNIKYELTWQLNTILKKMDDGMPMIEAVMSTPAKPPKKSKEH